jgi:hypothetical protein
MTPFRTPSHDRRHERLRPNGYKSSVGPSEATGRQIFSASREFVEAGRQILSASRELDEEGRQILSAQRGLVEAERQILSARPGRDEKERSTFEASRKSSKAGREFLVTGGEIL